MKSERSTMRIKIGLRNYKVTFLDHAILDDGSVYTGQIRYSAEEILVSKDQTPLGVRQTLTHEVVHAILRNIGQSEVGEEIVDGVANGVLEVLRRNPDMVQFLLEK